MAQSFYFEYFSKTYPDLVTAIVEKLNGKNTGALSYLYKTLLEPSYSTDGRWSSITAEYTRVAADVVSLNSSLPVKSRDSIEVAQGKIPKIGMKLGLEEKQMKDIDNMIASYQRNRMIFEQRRGNMPEAQRISMEGRLKSELGRIMNEIFQDTRRSIESIWERNEDIFLEELSSGFGLAEHNNGNGLRMNMGFKAENQFNPTALWNTDTATPLDDIQKIFDKAIEDQNTITDVYLDDTALQLLYNSKQVREQYAFNKGVSVSGIAGVPALDLAKINEIFRTKWEVTVHRVARKIKTEINGVKNSHSPWKKGAMTFVCDEIVGSLVWTDTAEANRQVEGTVYQTVDEYILVSKYAQHDPIKEITASQAMVVPILNNVDRIYTLDTQTVAA